MKCSSRKIIDNKYIIIIQINKRNFNLKQIYDLSGSLKIISQNIFSKTQQSGTIFVTLSTEKETNIDPINLKQKVLNGY